MLINIVMLLIGAFIGFVLCAVLSMGKIIDLERQINDRGN